MNMMKKYIAYMILPTLVLSSCSQKIVFDVDYNVTLNPENTYFAGEPVKFDITGNVDNLMMYTGEIGSEYRYKDRYEVAVEDVKSAELTLSIKGNYGSSIGGMTVYLSETFEGLDGSDAEKDREYINSLTTQMDDQENIPGWEKVPYVETKKDDGKFVNVTVDISKYVGHFAIAFHWHPSIYTTSGGESSARRTYRVNGEMDIDLGTGTPQSLSLKDFGYTNFMFGSWYESPYEHDKKDDKGTFNSQVRYNDNSGMITFIGESSTVHPDEPINAWVFSNPVSLNSVSNDKPLVVKDMQNYISSYEYTWNEPGTYTVTFVGVNANYAGASKEIHEFKVTILAK